MLCWKYFVVTLIVINVKTFNNSYLILNKLQYIALDSNDITTVVEKSYIRSHIPEINDEKTSKKQLYS
jgi:hypothetical protein